MTAREFDDAVVEVLATARWDRAYSDDPNYVRLSEVDAVAPDDGRHDYAIDPDRLLAQLADRFRREAVEDLAVIADALEGAILAPVAAVAESIDGLIESGVIARDATEEARIDGYDTALRQAAASIRAAIDPDAVAKHNAAIYQQAQTDIANALVHNPYRTTEGTDQ